MPRGDRTGPRGLGSMTGRGLGYCAGYDTPGFARGGSRMGLGRGWSGGRDFGYGRGFGSGRGRGGGYRAPIYTPTYNQYPIGIVPKITPEDQLAMLKQEKDFIELEMKGMKSAIDDISKRITDLEKE